MGTTYKYNNDYNTDDVNFVSSATSGVLDLHGRSPVAIVTPATFGQTTITFQAATEVGGTYYPVHGPTGTLLSITVDATNARWTDISGLALDSVGAFIKLVAGGSITKTVQVISRNKA